MTTLYIMQGVPGSGKSTLADAMAKSMFALVYSTDSFFYREGVYKFDPQKLGEYHALNFERTIRALDAGINVIVDNTNIQRWQCRPYVEYAVKIGVPVVFVRVTGEFESIHGVPKSKIQQMRSQLEDLTVESVLASRSPFERETSAVPRKCN